MVLLYNYYHRKQHPELPFLAFDEFCKLAVDLKPTLLAHMNFMQQSDETELNDVEKQLSVAEKMIMDACDICTCLDVSKNLPNIEGWPLSKVTVLLVDSEKENCFLLFGSITKGVWSVIEKDVDISSQSSEDTKGSKFTLKKKRVIRKPTKDKLNVDEAGLLQLGYSAVKEAAGNSSSTERLALLFATVEELYLSLISLSIKWHHISWNTITIRIYQLLIYLTN